MWEEFRLDERSRITLFQFPTRFYGGIHLVDLTTLYIHLIDTFLSDKVSILSLAPANMACAL